jgi:tetratricopeptide (TPR) repeat protein
MTSPSRTLTALIVILLLSVAAQAQAVPADPVLSNSRIVQQLRVIKEAEDLHLSDEKVGYLYAVLAQFYQDVGDEAPARQAFEHSLRLLEPLPYARENYAAALDNFGSLNLEFGHISEAESLRNRALAIRQQIGDPIEIAKSQHHLSEVALAQHHFKEAEEASSAAFDTLWQAGEKNGHPNRSTELSALVTMTYAECMLSRPADALRHAQQAMKMTEASQPDSLERAHVSLALGFALWKTGDDAAGEASIREGLRIMRRQLGEKSPILLAAMYEYRLYLKSTHRDADVKTVDLEIASIRQNIPLAPCTTCTVSAHSLR